MMYDDLDKIIDELNLDDYVDVEEETENMYYHRDSENMFCDNTGYCSGWSCPNYAKCHGLN